MSTTLPLILLALVLAIGYAADIEETWTITYKTVHPDGVPKLVPVINNQYPGPELRGKPGQTVQITVHNKLFLETTTIHWHGLKQTGTVWSDGVPGVSQCPIGPGETFVYSFRLDAPGSLWYHSHSALQKSSLYGAIVVEGDEPVLPKYDEERTLLFSDWYHASATEQVYGLHSVPFKWVGDAQSLLINGRGEFNCSEYLCSEKSKPCNSSHEEAGPFYLDVEPDTTYRLRLVGASSLAFLNFGIEHHPMSVVEAETTPLRPYRAHFLDVGSGQSYSVLVRTKSREELAAIPSNNGLFWMQLNIRHRKSGPIGRAILRYSNHSTQARYPTRPVPRSPGRNDMEWSLREVRKQKALTSSPLPVATRTISVLGTQNKQADGRIVWGINNISYVEPKTPVLHSVKLGVDQDTEKYVSREHIPIQFDYFRSLKDANLSEAAEEGTFVLKVRKDETIDFVFQNTVSLSNQLEVHPWHLHLHNFWVLKYGDMNTMLTANDIREYDEHTAVARNTFTLYPNSWVAIRVKMDNPGIAHFHCHLLPHLLIGMGFVVQIGEPHEMPPPPPGTPFCGTVSKLMGAPVKNPFVSGGCAA